MRKEVWSRPKGHPDPLVALVDPVMTADLRATVAVPHVPETGVVGAAPATANREI
jgi:hypothetical protein